MIDKPYSKGSLQGALCAASLTDAVPYPQATSAKVVGSSLPASWCPGQGQSPLGQAAEAASLL